MSENKSEINCNCLKSNCEKNYCECFKAGVGCRDSCRCINCKNMKKPELKFSHKILNEADLEKIQVARNPMNYIIQGTSIEIVNEKISVTDWKRTTNEMKTKNKIIEAQEPENQFKKNLKQNLFHVNYLNPLGNFQELNETPSVSNKKRRRINSKLDSTQPPTPLNFTTASDKMSNFKSIQFDDKIVKNLDKIYN